LTGAAFVGAGGAVILALVDCFFCCGVSKTDGDSGSGVGHRGRALPNYPSETDGDSGGGVGHCGRALPHSPSEFWYVEI
jgi:hypothetical protein